MNASEEVTPRQQDKLAHIINVEKMEGPKEPRGAGATATLAWLTREGKMGLQWGSVLSILDTALSFAVQSSQTRSLLFKPSSPIWPGKGMARNELLTYKSRNIFYKKKFWLPLKT